MNGHLDEIYIDWQGEQFDCQFHWWWSQISTQVQVYMFKIYPLGKSMNSLLLGACLSVKEFTERVSAPPGEQLQLWIVIPVQCT